MSECVGAPHHPLYRVERGVVQWDHPLARFVLACAYVNDALLHEVEQKLDAAKEGKLQELAELQGKIAAEKALVQGIRDFAASFEAGLVFSRGWANRFDTPRLWMRVCRSSSSPSRRRDSKASSPNASTAGTKQVCGRVLGRKCGQEFVIGGYTVGTKTFDALVFGYYEDDRLKYAARTRNGFTPVVREQLLKKFRGLEIKDCPFANLPEAKSGRWGAGLTAAKMKDCRWLKPVLVAQIEFVEWTGENHLRHTKFIALRDDKPAHEVRRE